MLPNINEIKFKRKQLGLTQTQLAEMAGVSQSLITKIESEKIVPSYENAKKIFDTIENLRKEKSLKAKDFMTKTLYYVNPGASVKHAAFMMRKHSVSQLPIVKDGKCLGTISEKTIVDKMQGNQRLEDMGKLEVTAVMEDSLPTIQEDAPFNVVSAMLEHYPAILVSKEGKIRGIISKSDLLNVMLK